MLSTITPSRNQNDLYPLYNHQPSTDIQHLEKIYIPSVKRYTINSNPRTTLANHRIFVPPHRIGEKLLKKFAASDNNELTSPSSRDLKNTLLAPIGIMTSLSKPASKILLYKTGIASPFKTDTTTPLEAQLKSSTEELYLGIKTYLASSSIPPAFPLNSITSSLPLCTRGVHILTIPSPLKLTSPILLFFLPLYFFLPQTK